MTVDREPPVLVETTGRVSVITLNRAARLNAMDAEMMAALVDALGIASRDPATGAVVLTGAGRAFCAGGDVNNMGVAAPTDTVLHRDWHLLAAIVAMEKPIIAMVSGPAVGLGLSVALAADLVYVDAEARLGDTHVSLGVLAGDGVVIPLIHLLGPHRAKEILLRATLMTGREAAELGFVNRACAAGDLRAETFAMAEQLASTPAYATRATKMVLNRPYRAALNDLLEPALAMEMVSMTMPEYAAAVARFRDSKQTDRPN
jgi:enoyl-CoA hydratase